MQARARQKQKVPPQAAGETALLGEAAPRKPHFAAAALEAAAGQQAKRHAWSDAGEQGQARGMQQHMQAGKAQPGPIQEPLADETEAQAPKGQQELAEWGPLVRKSTPFLGIPAEGSTAGAAETAPASDADLRRRRRRGRPAHNCRRALLLHKATPTRKPTTAVAASNLSQARVGRQITRSQADVAWRGKAV